MFYDFQEGEMVNDLFIVVKVVEIILLFSVVINILIVNRLIVYFWFFCFVNVLDIFFNFFLIYFKYIIYFK